LVAGEGFVVHYPKLIQRVGLSQKTDL